LVVAEYQGPVSTRVVEHRYFTVVPVDEVLDIDPEERQELEHLRLGDHSIFIGSVLDSRRGPGRQGLLFFDGRFHAGVTTTR